MFDLGAAPELVERFPGPRSGVAERRDQQRISWAEAPIRIDRPQKTQLRSRRRMSGAGGGRLSGGGLRIEAPNISVLEFGLRQRQRRSAVRRRDAGAKQVEARRAPPEGKANPLEPRRPADRQCGGEMAQPPRGRTVAGAQRALEIGAASGSEQPQRRRGRVKELGVPAENREHASFGRLIIGAARRREQRDGQIGGEYVAVFRGLRRRCVQSRLAIRYSRGRRQVFRRRRPLAKV